MQARPQKSTMHMERGIVQLDTCSSCVNIWTINK